MLFDAIDRSGTYAVKLESRIAKFGTDDLLPLWVADMDIVSPAAVQEAIAKRARHPIYGYTVYPEEYYRAIISWMRRRFGWEVRKEWIVPAHGVVSSINCAIEALSGEGDGVIVQTPVYPPFIASVKHHGRKLLENRLLYRDECYHIDFDDFEAKAKEAKLFLLCSPHNPTGRVWDKEEIERLTRVCKEHGVTIISDEIHADVVYAKKHHVAASLQHDNIITLNAPSKTFNIAGLNSSYAIIPDPAQRSAYAKAQQKCGLGGGNPFGIEALIAAYNEGEPWLELLKKHLSHNIDLVKNFIAKNDLPIKTVDTEGTFMMWLDCRAMGYNDDALERFFIHNAKLGLNGGRSFGEAGSGFMRLNIGTSQEILQKAMVRLHFAFFQ